jgi:NAD(P)H-dependent flavin oxidoreductase YrpB (nitropropane dioxygenase family)
VPATTFGNAELMSRPTLVVDCRRTLIPTRDHSHAAKSKNYRYSCNAQVLVRRPDLEVVATAAGGPGNRNDPAHYLGSEVQVLCKLHATTGDEAAISPTLWEPFHFFTT